MFDPDGWEFWIDTGGTFTDCLGRAPDGGWHRAKVLSSSSIRSSICSIDRRSLVADFPSNYPDDFLVGFRVTNVKSDVEFEVLSYDSSSRKIILDKDVPAELRVGDLIVLQFSGEAPELGARVISKTPGNKKLPESRLRIATTKGTNALLEKKGAPTVLFLNEGLGDLLRINSQQRPDIFALNIQRPSQLYQEVIEVETEPGTGLPDTELLEERVGVLLESGVQTAAVCLMHSYKNAEAEELLAKYLKEKGFSTVITSNRCAPFIKILPRAETTLVDAYLSPMLSDYLDGLVDKFGSSGLSIMTSSGGLVPRKSFRSCDSLFSGPAGGVLGAVAIGTQAGCRKIIGFDMGGTSTDVTRFDGALSYQFETRVGQAHVLAPSLKIETVAAGGGSVCIFDGERLRVGPESAGANPGPACYGAGGPLTVTDVNLLLGRMDAEQFSLPIDLSKSEERLAELISALSSAKDGLSPEKLLAGLLEIANENMTDAIRKISTSEGYDPADYGLVAFGGAGGQHACGIAEKLGISTLLFPGDAGLLSASGLFHAVPESFAVRQLLCPFAEFENQFENLTQSLIGEAQLKLHESDRPHSRLSRRIVSLRLSGQESALDVDWIEEESILSLYEKTYRSIFGYGPDLNLLEVLSYRVVVSLVGPPVEEENFPESSKIPEAVKSQRAFSSGQWVEAKVYERGMLQPGMQISGPAIIQDPFSTLFVDQGWTAQVGSKDTLKVDLVSALRARNVNTGEVEIELFSNRFQTLVEDMGVRLMRTAVSTNVKDRLDFSCALLDADGGLVVNAPHIPVHLGALGMCVKKVSESHNWKSGEMVVTNHPGFGGSHLPDISIICPVFSGSESLIGFLVNRAHHAELGGIAPGSMPPAASSLAEEAVVIPPVQIMADGELTLPTVEKLLKNGPYPTRRIEENLADLKAQVAANLKGLEDLETMIQTHGQSRVTSFMQAIQDRAEKSLRRKLRDLPDGEYLASQKLDDGTPLDIKAVVSDDHISLKLSDCGGVHSRSFNATPGIVYSAVIYFLRVWLDEPMPLNEGLLRPVSIEIPEGLLNPPFPDDPADCPPVVAGNVETSQRLVDTLLLLFEVVACSQGTMNNLIFGNERVSFYETIAGGAGAGDGFAGESGIHVHMTNTGITDPEILEHKYPVKLKEFSIRKGSGGSGKFSGGDGVIRELEFTEPVSLSLLTQHRVEAPYGLKGGAPGKTGEQWLIRKGQEPVQLASTERLDVESGDHLRILTPGGGGWGTTP